MPYILCELDRANGEVRLLAARTFASPGDATRALATAQADRPAAASEVFLVDLDAATPVVVVPVSADSAPAATGPGPVLVPEEPWTRAADDTTADGLFWMSEAGIVTAASGEEPEADGAVADEWTHASPADICEAKTVGEPTEGDWPFVAAEDAAVGPTLLADERADDDIARSELWWVEVGAESDAAVPEGAEPAPLTYGADAEDIADVAAELSALVGEIPREEPLREEPTAEQEPLPSLEDAAAGLDLTPVDTACETPEALDASRDVTDAGRYDVDAAYDDARILGEYDAAADPGLTGTVEDATFVSMDFDAWRCTDCVFTSTCPRTGVDRPATCGSFQWRTE